MTHPTNTHPWQRGPGFCHGLVWDAMTSVTERYDLAWDLVARQVRPLPESVEYGLNVYHIESYTPSK